MAVVIDRKVPRTLDQRTGVGRRRLLAIVGIFTLVVGIGSFAGGAFGAVYTWNQATAENITTPDDAIFPEVPLRGPLSMYAQAQIIETHQLDTTEGLRYSEMERQVASLDEAGSPILDAAGEPVMVANAARASWITATALITALNLGLLAYALSAFALVVGITMIASGLTFLSLRKALIA